MSASSIFPSVSTVLPPVGALLTGVGAILPGVGRILPAVGRVLPGVGRVLPGGSMIPPGVRGVLAGGKLMPTEIGTKLPAAKVVLPAALATCRPGWVTLMASFLGLLPIGHVSAQVAYQCSSRQGQMIVNIPDAGGSNQPEVDIDLTQAMCSDVSSSGSLSGTNGSCADRNAGVNWSTGVTMETFGIRWTLDANGWAQQAPPVWTCGGLQSAVNFRPVYLIHVPSATSFRLRGTYRYLGSGNTTIVVTQLDAPQGASEVTRFVAPLNVAGSIDQSGPLAPGTYRVQFLTEWSATSSQSAASSFDVEHDFVLYIGACLPTVTQQPVSQTVCEGFGTQFTVGTTNATAFQWRHNGIPISLASNASANQSTLVLVTPTQGDEGTYDCIITGACGPVISEAAVLTLLSFDEPGCAAICDTIDFNQNGVFPEDQDIVDYLDVLAGGSCPTCNDIDFNNNGVFPEDQDVIDFFNVLAGGACP